MDLPKWILQIRQLVKSDKVGYWCRLPYPRHSKGCPNYGKKAVCPPDAPAVDDFFDTGRPLYLVHSEFDLSAYIERMKRKHPKWSLAQCQCVLYWQPASRRQLKKRISVAAPILGTDTVTTVPEAMGVNVYVTARLAGLRLERIRSLSICRHVAMIGFGKMGHRQRRLF